MDVCMELGIALYECLNKMNAAEIVGCIQKLAEETTSETSKNELYNILNIMNR